jgi:alpha-1,3-mannosyltransferase
LQQSKNRYRIFLLGGEPGVAIKAAVRMMNNAHGHQFVGCCHGYVARQEIPQVVEQIRQSRADILLVAMGNPQQETWLNEYLEDTGCRLGFGVGGLFDFIAGVVPRAPQWVRMARIEWAYRLMQQPGRLWRRYLLEMPIFLVRVGKQWLMGARIPTATPL